jgi:predicted RNA-binding Zn ribbon-like protein
VDPDELPAKSTGGETVGEVRDGFKFRSGRLSLDLPATLAGRLRAEPRDLLATPRDLGRWLAAAGLARHDLAPTAEELRGARELREALYRLALASARGQGFADADREVLNRWAAEAAPAPQLAPQGITWTGTGVRPALAVVARDGVELLGGPLARRVRECAGDGCALLFVDTSRSAKRRWCSMSACGGKAKVAEFRRRRRVDGG